MVFYGFIKSLKSGDIDFFVETGYRFINHIDLYKMLYNESIYYVYSPVFSFLISPLTFLPIFLVRFAWALLNIYFVLEIYKIIVSLLPQTSSRKVLNFIIVLSTIFTIHFFNLNFIIGQMTICMLYICLKAVYENEKKNIVLAGFLLAIGISIKVMPIVIFAYFFYNKCFKTLGFVCVFLVILFASPYIVMPIEVMNSQYLSWIDALFNGGGGFTREYSNSMHSLHSTSLVYLTNDSHDIEGDVQLPFYRDFANLSIENVKLVSYSVSFFLIILTPFFLKRLPFTQPKSSLHLLYEVGYLCLITPLIFPMQQKYGYLFTLPSVLYLFYVCFENRFKGNKMAITTIFMIIFFFMVSLSTVDLVIGSTLKMVSEYYKLIVWGTLLLIVPYLINYPKNHKSI